MKTSRHAWLVMLAAMATGAYADEVTVTVNAISADGIGAVVGTVLLTDTEEGLRLTPSLEGLPPGEHGFHVHQNPSCGPAEKDGSVVAGLAAGGHFDPHATGSHRGPGAEGGHLGDLPLLVIDQSGGASAAMNVPGLTVADVRGRALMIHEMGDNYSDDPKPLGGGGARIACGVIE